MKAHNFLFRSRALLALRFQSRALYLSLGWPQSNGYRSQRENKINQQLNSTSSYPLSADKLTFSCIKWKNFSGKVTSIISMKKYSLYSIRNEYFWKIQRGTYSSNKNTMLRFPFFTKYLALLGLLQVARQVFLSQKSQTPLKHTPSNWFLFILLQYCHAYYSYKSHFRALSSGPLQVKNWLHLQHFILTNL